MNRLEMLREMKLLPLWRVRALAPAPQPSLATSGDATSYPAGNVMAAPSYVADAAGPAARAAHIATLEWDALERDIAACTACGLCRTRNRVVPGVGARRAEWLFVGEAPGADEDLQGEPFVGQGGRLLDNMLTAIGLARSDRVYIANVLKCRPPQNRAPEPGEIDACLPYLKRQIALLAPKLIVALGRSAAATLLATDASIAALRGRVHRFEGTAVVVTYHPAYLLRTPGDKAKAWEDLCLARATLSSGADDDLLQKTRGATK